MLIWPGRPYPLGATYDGTGTNFALFSEVAERVELCLFDEDGHRDQVDLPEVDAFVWHGYLPAIAPGQRYGYRVHGPDDPTKGDRCDPSKLLLDPYAKAIDGQIDGHASLYSYHFDDPDERNEDDSGAAHHEVGGHQPVLRLGPRPPAAARVPRVGHLRGARARPDEAAPGGARRAARHVRAAWRTRRSSST